MPPRPTRVAEGPVPLARRTLAPASRADMTEPALWTKYGAIEQSQVVPLHRKQPLRTARAEQCPAAAELGGQVVWTVRR